MTQQAVEFLTAVYGTAIGKDARLAIWCLPEKRTRWFESVGDAAAYGVNAAKTSDVYVGCGLYRNGISRGRGKAADVIGVTCMWADIDYGEHSKSRIAPDLESAQQILARVRLEPSIVVNSGHGLHAYWVLKELLLASDGAAKLVRRWGATVRAAAEAIGYVVDSVGDLTRVLRLPETFNRKRDPIVPVEIVAITNSRYDASDIDEWAVDTVAAPSSKAVIADVVVDPTRVFPADKLVALIENDPRFAATWRRERKDLRDDSPSGYEMAVASAGFTAGYSDQEVVDLLIRWGQKHGLDRIGKLRRTTYLEPLLAKAKVGVSVAKVAAEVAEFELGTEEEAATVSHRQEIIAMLRKALGVEIARWVQFGKEKAIFSMFLCDGTEIMVGGVEVVTGQKRCRDVIYETTGVLGVTLKPASWRKVCQALARIRELDEARESSLGAQVAEWVDGYLGRGIATITETEEQDAMVTDWRPFIRDGALHITINGLSQYARFSRGNRIAARMLGKILKQLGWQRKHISYSTATSRSSRSYYHKKLSADDVKRAVQ